MQASYVRKNLKNKDDFGLLNLKVVENWKKLWNLSTTPGLE